MLRAKAAASQGANEVVVFDGLGHFELEQSGHDDMICSRILAWIEQMGLIKP